MLHIKYRPNHWNQVVGNLDTVNYLKTVADNAERPHSYLMTGPSGCGKTTLARILAAELGCAGSDFTEIDVGDYRGIDSVREIRQAMSLTPMVSSCRVWLLDECFVKGTKIAMADGGTKAIEAVKKDEEAISLYGLDKVKRTFTKKIPLERLVRVNIEGRQPLYCSDGHEFFTSTGWKRAKFLTHNDFIFPLTLPLLSNIKQGINLPNRGSNGKYPTSEKMPRLWSGITSEKQVLLQSMRQFLSWEKLAQIFPTLFRMREACTILARTARQVQSSILWKKVFGFKQNETPRDTGRPLLPANPKEDLGSTKTVYENRQWNTSQKTAVRAYESKQPLPQSGMERKSTADQTNQRNAPYMEGREGRERKINPGADLLGQFAGVEDGSSYSHKKEIPLPNILQSGHRERDIENCYRGGWKRSSNSFTQSAGSKKRFTAPVIRVESITIYQSGYNEQSFLGIVGDQERSTGFIELYDLEMSHHPSYFANGVAVHNCHRLTSDAQAALLKALEDAPKYAYFILATTDPKKLLPTILNRCTPCPVKPLTEEEMKRLLTRAARGENRAKDLTQEVVDSIIEVADGAPRAGLVVLEKYLANPDAPIVSLGESSKEIIDLCRLLLKKQSWRTVSKTLQALKGQDAEEIRRAVLGYCAAVLLKGADDPQALALLDIFREPFYNSGWPGVVWACCLSVQKG